MKHILLFLKGMAMGAADLVPGVSGGTIAFIVGIYDRLLSSISSVNFSLIKVLKEQGIAAAWKKVDGNFLVTLFGGIFTSIFLLANLLDYLMQHHPILLWGFFFGLIVSSILYMIKQVKSWSVFPILGLIVGALFVFGISTMPPLGVMENKLFLFFAGFIAICAMILPGISGSFILLMLGAYSSIIAAISDKKFTILGIVALGAISGLLVFSRILKFILTRYPNTTIATLTGFLIGSLWKIWPWKINPSVYIKEKGETSLSDFTELKSLSAYLPQVSSEKAHEIKPFIEQNILPNVYSELNGGIDAQIIGAIIASIIGFSLIYFTEKFASQNN